MQRDLKTYGIITLLLILGIVALEYSKPKEVNWFPSYAIQHKIPYGTYVNYQQMQRLFPQNGLTSLERPPFEILTQTDSLKGAYVFINDKITFGEDELQLLLDWVHKGNTAYIAASNFDQPLLDTLGLGTKFKPNPQFNTKTTLKLSNTLLDTSVHYFDRPDYLYYFNKIDTLNTAVVSVLSNAPNQANSTSYVNAIKQPFGKGTFILNTFPQAFTNYFLLTSPNQNYTAGLLSYLNGLPHIYLDAYYKSGKPFYTSPLYILLNNKPLKWAYYSMLIGVLLYIIFEGKRKQRAIPIVTPLKNRTLDFTKTIANMYFEKSDHKAIAELKIQYFMDYVRAQLHIETNVINEDFINKLAARSNHTVETTTTLIETIKQLQQKTKVDAKDLEHLNRLIETFKL